MLVVKANVNNCQRNLKEWSRVSFGNISRVSFGNISRALAEKKK